MATLNDTRLDNPRRSAGPAFRGQGGYGVVGGRRRAVATPVAALAGDPMAFPTRLIAEDQTHG